MIHTYLNWSLIGVGIAQILLGLVHVFFKAYFKWEKELAPISLLTRQIFYVHTFFIAMVVSLFGLLTILCYQELLVPSKIGLYLSILFLLFWTVRLVVQFFGYSAKLWRGDPFRTAMHILFTFLWIWFTSTYGSLVYLQLVAS